jgi:two-component sensor histidine kinase
MSLLANVSALPQPRFEPTREADHRIANSLASISSLVRIRARAANGVIDVGTFLTEIADRIDTVAKLHRLLASSNTGSVSIHDYLHEICERLSSALAPIAPLFSLTCPAAYFVPFNIALPLGLITAELFSNSLKYAHPAGLPVKISVTCSRSAGNELSLIYEDDGVGFPEEFDLLHDGHLGMRFIRTLSAQLNGAHEWLSDSLGVRFEITVPNQ